MILKKTELEAEVDELYSDSNFGILCMSKAMLERATSDYTSQVEQSSKAMKDDSGVQEICNGSPNEEKKPRNDFLVGMEPEVEIAQQHFVNTSYDVDSLLANACI
jgi:hypothetical protein